MPEQKFILLPYGVDYVCDSCGEGHMQQTGIMKASDPPWWTHRCDKCGVEQDLREKYPTVRFERRPQG